MSTTGHWKVVYPPGTERGTRRTSRNASVYLVLGDREIKIPGVTGLKLATGIDDVDRVTLEALGTVEVLYAEAEAEGPASIAEEGEEDWAALIAAVRDTNRADT